MPFTPPGQTTPLSSGGPVVGAGSGRCLDVPNPSHVNGAQVQLRNCSGRTSQQWARIDAGELARVRAKCLDAEASGPAPGTRTVIWDCHGGQPWSFLPAMVAVKTKAWSRPSGPAISRT
ncbi:ricin-type beta-trefoil lectin domain protein [Streptomyces europaeiscabiei]|uniref:ricin-type beta-trefoil lectin domain protein n=1 Tax=Streptomyces europaeiscabiei TaxID=146819 RepID=UPI00399A39B0